MKNLFSVLATLLAVCFFFFGCAAHVKLTQDDSGIKFDHAGGYASPERGLEILEEQIYVQERQEILALKKSLYKKLTTAIDSLNAGKITKKLEVMIDSLTATGSLNAGEINKIQKMIESMNNGFSTAQTMIEAIDNSFSSSTAKCRYLGIRNSDPKYSVRIKNGPFEGQYLNPGERTHTKKPFPVGVFPLEYEWYQIGTNSRGTNTIHLSIGEYRTEDIIFNQWDN